MSTISLLFVWAIILSLLTRLTQTDQIISIDNASETNLVTMIQEDNTDIITSIKNQIYELYNSGCNRVTDIDRMIQLLITYQEYEDTSDLLDSSPYILDYIFSNSA